MNSSHWLGLLELLIVFGFLLGWAVLELILLRYDKRRNKIDDTRRSPNPDD